MTWQTRFDRLLKAMASGHAPERKVQGSRSERETGADNGQAPRVAKGDERLC